MAMKQPKALKVQTLKRRGAVLLRKTKGVKVSSVKRFHRQVKR
jgi:hypothetical protein